MGSHCPVHPAKWFQYQKSEIRWSVLNVFIKCGSFLSLQRAPPTKPDAPEIVWIPVADAGWEYPDQRDFAGELFRCHECDREDGTIVFRIWKTGWNNESDLTPTPIIISNELIAPLNYPSFHI